MSSAICFNLDQSKILSSGNELNIASQRESLPSEHTKFIEQKHQFQEN